MKNKISALVILSLMLSLICVLPIEAKSKNPKISNKSVTLKIGKTKTLSVIKSGKAVSKVKWKSSNKKIASVSSKGVIKAKKKGKTTIVAKVGKKQYKCKLTVKANLSYDKHVGKKHNWIWIVDQAAYNEDIYEDKPVYEERPVYEDTYEVWEVYIFDTGEKFYTYCFTTETIGDFYQMKEYAETTYGSYNAGMCHCSIRDEQVKTGTKQTGTEKVQTGTERVKTGTKHHKEKGHYECSCGATK